MADRSHSAAPGSRGPGAAAEGLGQRGRPLGYILNFNIPDPCRLWAQEACCICQHLSNTLIPHNNQALLSNRSHGAVPGDRRPDAAAQGRGQRGGPGGQPAGGAVCHARELPRRRRLRRILVPARQRLVRPGEPPAPPNPPSAPDYPSSFSNTPDCWLSAAAPHAVLFAYSTMWSCRRRSRPPGSRLRPRPRGRRRGRGRSPRSRPARRRRTRWRGSDSRRAPRRRRTPACRIACRRGLLKAFSEQKTCPQIN